MNDFASQIAKETIRQNSQVKEIHEIEVGATAGGDKFDRFEFVIPPRILDCEPVKTEDLEQLLNSLIKPKTPVQMKELIKDDINLLKMVSNTSRAEEWLKSGPMFPDLDFKPGLRGRIGLYYMCVRPSTLPRGPYTLPGPSSSSRVKEVSVQCVCGYASFRFTPRRVLRKNPTEGLEKARAVVEEAPMDSRCLMESFAHMMQLRQVYPSWSIDSTADPPSFS